MNGKTVLVPPTLILLHRKDFIDNSKVVKSISPGTDLSFSSIIKRSDDTSLNDKIHNVNVHLKRQCSELGYDFIDNDSINAACLNQSGLYV